MNALRSTVFLALSVLVFLNHALAATGPIRIAKDFPHSFQYQSGERFFPMGDTAYFLIAQPTNVIARFIDSRRAHQFNFMRMMPMARGHWAFGGTPRRPDYTVINQTAMQTLDWIFDYAASKGMNIELTDFYPPQTIPTLTQVGYTGFRWATLIDPFWNAYYLGLVISLADQIELTFWR